MELDLRKLTNGTDPKSQNEPILNYMKEIKWFSNLIHMWPQKTVTTLERVKHIIIVLLNFIFLSLFVCSFIVHIAMFYKNMDGIAETVDHVTVYISGTFRYIYIYIRRNKYLKLIGMLRDGFISRPMFADESEDILRRYFKRAKYLIILYNVPVVFWNLQVVFQPVVHYVVENLKKALSNTPNDKEINFDVPIVSYFPIDIEKLPGSVLFYLWTTYGIILVGIIYMCIDDFWIMTIIFTVGQFDILKTSYEKILQFPEDVEYPDKVELLDQERTKLLEERINKCMQYHSFLREFIELSDDLFNPNVLMNYCHAIISIAFLLLEVTITIKTGKWNAFSHALQYLLLSIGHMFLFNWLGNQLIVKEEKLGEAVYNLPWYKFPSQKHSIAFILSISRRTHGLTCGRTFTLTLKFFTATIRVIFSYFTFLLQIRNQTEIKY